mmetsp:Transcript_41833/g.55153  ORF Transcript_41833/g.55153 Transcript_41833/m.55153 type:complete len:139 (+) Transcript_41833:78-494(+)
MVEPRKLGTADHANIGTSPRAGLYTGGNAVTFEGGSQSPSFVTLNASVITPQTLEKDQMMQKDTFGLKIFGRSPTKKQTAKEFAAVTKKREKEEAEAKKKEEEKKKEEDEVNQGDDVESDHHGRIFVDYRQPRPSNFP